MAKKKLSVPADGLNGEYLPKADEYRGAVDRHNRQPSFGSPRLGRSRSQRVREPRFETRERALTAEDIRRIARDPVRLAEVMADARRPEGVSTARHGIAIRKAAGDKMLTARGVEVERGLDSNNLPKLVSGGIYERMIVKPRTTAAAKAGRSSSFWGERSWAVHQPRYGRGFFIRYDTGGDSRVYGSIAELRGVVKRSGFDIIKR